MFSVKGLRFSYKVGTRKVDVLKGVDLEIRRGDFIAIQGPSGSGKSTLFHILGFLLKTEAGQVSFDGKDVSRLGEDELAYIRNRRIGFIFQQFHLLSRTTVLENILLPTRYPVEVARERDGIESRARELATKFGLGEHLTHLPNQLSGGQQQRVAIARALLNDADLILADEPTGNLDSENARQILDLLEELNREGRTIVLITHDGEVARRCRRVYHMKDGLFVRTEENGAPRASSGVVAPPSNGPSLQPPRTFAAHAKLVRAVLPLAVDNLWRNKTKSLLTMLGVVIGVASVLSMITLGQFTKKKVIASYETLGANKLSVWGYQNWNMRATDSVGANFDEFGDERDLKPLRRIFPEIRLLSPFLYDPNLTAIAGGRSIPNNVTSVGVSPEYLEITNRKIVAGRALSPFHVDSRSPVCIVGFEIAKQLFQRVNPIGQILTLSDNRRTSYPCRVIGVLKSQTSTKEWNKPDYNVLMADSYFKTVASQYWYQKTHNFLVQVTPETDIIRTGKRIKAYFESKYGKSGRFSVDSDSELIAQMKRFLSLFAVLLGAIASISLAVGGIGINNMMLVAVNDRLREFGIRKALGATNRTIRVQVLAESVILCAVAGVVGVVIGFAAYQGLIFGATKFVSELKFEWVFEPLAILLSFIAILAVGIASGLAPAFKAERLQIIEALRSE